MIDTCPLLGDYQRAAQWLEAIDNSPITACITSYPSDCDTHRTQVLVGRGAWSEAERLARRACAGMKKFDVSHVGLAFYELDQLRLRLGDLDAAAVAFARAAELGVVPQPVVFASPRAIPRPRSWTSAKAPRLDRCWGTPTRQPARACCRPAP